ncbi:MAG: DUF5666 domain-containing protein [Pseudomonadota bacterium]
MTLLSSLPFPSALRTLCTGLIAASLLTACGGGGDDAASSGSAAPASQGAGSLRQGPITGFGSIIVNGVRFDDSAAQVLDDDGEARGRDDLRLGMWVEVEGDAVGNQTTGVARSVRFGSQIQGPVEAVNVGAGTLTVLGQTVAVDTSTVYGGLANGLASIAPGAVVEVHGVTQTATGRVMASRVELASAPREVYKLRGAVTAVNTATRTFNIGTATISYGNLNASGVVVGAVVRVRLETVKQADVWVATRLVVQGQKKANDYNEADIHGVVTAYTSPTQFSLNGVPVNAANAVFEDGTSGVVLGARLEVEGRLVDGVLVARKVEIDGRDDGKDDEDDERRRPELHGLIGDLNATARTFVLRGVSVSYGPGTEFRSISEAQLRNGVKVEVKGTLAANGTISATRIALED